MLLDQQAAELLKRCEEIVGTELSQVRGNLSKAETRASAVWELIVLEAASQIGQVEYEPLPGGSPDIQLFLPENRAVWIEVAFLYPRFWKEERKSIAVNDWIFSEAKRRDILPCKIYPRLDGLPKKNAGPVRILPELNERKKFLNSQEIKHFFDDIVDKPNMPHRIYCTDYTISIDYSPNASGNFRISGGLAQEQPTSVEEHAVYRVLKEKAEQHDVSGPRVICIGSDQSQALSRMRGPHVVSLENAINEAFKKKKSLSATMIVAVENVPIAFEGIKKQVRGEIFINPYSKTSLMPEEIQLLLKLDFSKWKYADPLVNWKNEGREHFYSVTGTLTWSPGPLTIKVEIPANIVVDSLAGKTTLAEAFDLKKDTQVYRAINEGWEVTGCSYKNGNIELGEAPKFILELSHPFKVYKRNKKDAF